MKEEHRERKVMQKNAACVIFAYILIDAAVKLGWGVE